MHNTALTDKIPWIALHVARHTWPALSKDLARQLAVPELQERLLQGGVKVLETVLPGLSEKLLTVQKSGAFADELDYLQTQQVMVLPLTDPLYPTSLRWIPDPPPVLYVLGTLHPHHSLAVAVVGSRKPSNYGKVIAQRLSAALAQCGYTVVSGLARGIDSNAHQGTLQAGGQTLAVLGSGLNVVYPPENRRLFDRIRAQGAVLSELPYNTKPDRWNFPRRNRIISGLTLGTLVVEATAHSGALHTARHALEQGREVFAVPGRIDAPNSRGTHHLIKCGAKLVDSIDDILEEFPEAVRASARSLQAPVEAETPQIPADLSPQASQVLALMPSEATHIDSVIRASQLPAHVIASILVTLEVRGLVQQFPGKFFARSASAMADTFGKRN